MMTRKDFEATAAILRSEIEHWDGYNTDEANGATYTVEKLAEKFADMFADENPRFDRERFLDAALGMDV